MSNINIISLPIPPPVFLGRDRDLERLKKGFSFQNFICINGIAGIGKTSLALTLAHHINEDSLYKTFNGNVFWIECLEYWQIENILYEINRCLKSREEYDFEQFLEDHTIDVENKIHYLINILNKNSYAIFIDDYHRLKGSDFNYFLKYLKQYLKNSKIIIISRKKPRFSSEVWLETFEQKLSGLSQEDSLDLITSLLDLHALDNIFDNNLLENLKKMTKGHPFLIKNFLGILISGRGTIMEELKDSSVLQDAAKDYLLSQVLSNLEDKERKLLMALSLFRIPVNKEAFRYFSEDEDIENLIAGLKDHFLIELHSANTYLIHDLMRDYCASTISREEKENIHKNCAYYYENQETNFKDEDTKLLFLKEAFYHCIEAEDYDKASNFLEKIKDKMFLYLQLKELQQKVEEIPVEFRNNRIKLIEAEILFTGGKYTECDKLLDEIEQSSQIMSDIEYINLKTKSNLYMGEIEKALNFIDKSIEIYETSVDPFYLIRALETKGTVNFELRQYAQALECFQRAGEINEEQFKSKEIKILLSVLTAMALERTGEIERALEINLEALKLAQETNNRKEIATLKINTGWNYYQLGTFDMAYKLLKEGLEIAYSDPLRIYSLYFTGLVLEEKGRKNEALSYYIKALDLAKKTKDIEKQLIIESVMAGFYIKTGEYKEAEKVVKNMEISNKTHNTSLIAEKYLLEAELEFVNKNQDRGFSLLNKAIKSCNEELDIYQMSRAVYLMSLFSKKETEKRKFYQEAMELSDKLKGHEKRKISKYFSFYESLTASHRETKKSDKKYHIKLNDREYEAGPEDLEKLQKEKNDFDLWVDTTTGMIWEKNKGSINISRKKSLANLLFLFVKNPGETFTMEEIFSRVWEAKYDDVLDKPTVKTSISRLRKMLEPDLNNLKYIKNYSVLYKSETRYFFPEDIKFCLIEECQSGKRRTGKSN